MIFKTYFISSILFFLFLCPFILNAQIFEEFETENKEKEEENKDTKLIKPKIATWVLSENGAFIDSIGLDTFTDNFHDYHPVFIDALSASYLGNYGTPGVDNDFFNRKSSVNYLFLKNREAYLLTPDKIQYYNSRTPYTRLDFSQSENRVVKNETRFNVFHSQNINPYLNFTFKINLAKSAGQYNAQESKNNYITLYSSYNTDNLSLYAGFITNNVKNNENGGLTSDDQIFNGAESELLNTNLNSSSSLFKSTYYFTNAEYRLGKTMVTETDSALFRPTFGFLLDAVYERNDHDFIDTEAAGNTFFGNTYYDDAYTKDSMRFNRLNLVFQLKQYENTTRKYSFGKRAYIGTEFVKSISPGPDTINFVSDVNDYTDIYLGGGIFRQTGKFWNWKFDGRLYFAGAKAGQTELAGLISKPFRVARDSSAALVIQGSLNNIVPDYFQNEYYSNHYRWNNNFNMEQRMDVNGSIISPGYKLKLSANYALINNFIYNNYEGIPSQTDKELLVLSAYADKDFGFRNLHLHTKLLWQQVSDEQYIHLPDLSVFASVYYKFVISKVMFTQIGVDTRYNTKYYADAYSPATGLFYLQDEKKYGNYPYIDVFANLRLKRTRAFFKWSNVGTNFLDGEYFTVLHYPMPRSTFRFGLSWLFYD